jgi:hypothetical protein
MKMHNKQHPHISKKPKIVNWKPGNPLPNAENAEIDPRKFSDYSTNPDNPQNQGKWMAFSAIGYDVQTPTSRESTAQILIEQLRQAILEAPANPGKLTPYGVRFNVFITIQGASGQQGILKTVWQIDRGKENPRLITNWLEVYQDPKSTQ